MSYTFRWTEPAQSVFVTGTFDDWSGHSVQLDRVGDAFEKTIPLKSDDKVLYKVC